MTEEVIVANADAIKIIKKEIAKMEQAKYNEASNDLHVTESREGHKDVLLDVKVDVKKKPKKCRYFNRGYCKYKTKCRFTHLLGLCSQYLQTGKCGKSECDKRHPKSCKWDNGMNSCKRGIECMYLHVSVDQVHNVHKNHIEQNVQEGKQYPCVGCKYSWKERHHVKSHIIQNIEVFFCLNCDDWIQDKSAIFETGWTMFDESGGLRYDV